MPFNRPLTSEERALVRWMLEHAVPSAAEWLPQLEVAEVTPWRCPCGCASINFEISGQPAPPPGCHPIADFVFGDKTNLSGIFVFESGGMLAGLELYGLADEHPKSLPTPTELRPLNAVG